MRIFISSVVLFSCDKVKMVELELTKYNNVLIISAGIVNENTTDLVILDALYPRSIFCCQKMDSDASVNSHFNSVYFFRSILTDLEIIENIISRRAR